eukprot:396766_1
MLLIIMHQFGGLLNKKINVLIYPNLFRLCQNRMDKKLAQKTSCKEWLHRWMIFVQNPTKMNKHEQFLSIDLGSYNSPVSPGNISWDSTRVLPPQSPDGADSVTNKNAQYIYVWNADRRDFSEDIHSIHRALGVKSVVLSFV